MKVMQMDNMKTWHIRACFQVATILLCGCASYVYPPGKSFYERKISRLGIEIEQPGTFLHEYNASEQEALPIVAELLQEKGYIVCDTNRASATKATPALSADPPDAIFALRARLNVVPATPDRAPANIEERIWGTEEYPTGRIYIFSRLVNPQTRKVILHLPVFSCRRYAEFLPARTDRWRFAETEQEFLKRAIREALRDFPRHPSSNPTKSNM